MLGDCLVTGISDDEIPKELLAVPKLTYMEITQGYEEAEKNMK